MLGMDYHGLLRGGLFGVLLKLFEGICLHFFDWETSGKHKFWVGALFSHIQTGGLFLLPAEDEAQVEQFAVRLKDPEVANQPSARMWRFRNCAWQ